jgi:hypothetical protein
MLFLHETHDVGGGKMHEFGEAVRTTWRAAVERPGEARLLWYWELTHGTGISYQAVSITAVRDWATWGAAVDRVRTADTALAALRKDVTRKLLLPTPWSPLQAVDLDTPPVAPTAATPGLYLHDTGWPYPGKLDDYVAALGSIYLPQVRQSRMISVEACWTVAPGTGRQHEVVLLQKILDWARFTELLATGEQGAQRSGWMIQGLAYRDRWESKLLRCAGWSPLQ